MLEQSVAPRAKPDQKALQCNSVTRLKQEYFTLAEALKQAGYATGHFGKWHLGREPYDPLHQGFDVDVPHTFGPGPAGSYLAPWKFRRISRANPASTSRSACRREAVPLHSGSIAAGRSSSTTGASRSTPRGTPSRS